MYSNLTISEKPLMTDTTAPLLPEHYDPDLLKLFDVYEKRIFQSNLGLDFRQIKSRILDCSELTQGISQLEKETDLEIQLVLDQCSRKETALQQRLDDLDRELEKTKREREQQDQTRLNLEKKLSEVNKQYELKDTIDQELDELALAVDHLAATFQQQQQQSETTNHLNFMLYCLEMSSFLQQLISERMSIFLIDSFWMQRNKIGVYYLINRWRNVMKKKKQIVQNNGTTVQRITQQVRIVLF
ncbi:unnamed protein product [Rhizopus stolonifer]